MSPGKITEYKKPETSGDDETYDSFIKEIGKIDEINTEIGLNHVTGDKAIYHNTVGIFHQKLVAVCTDMTAFLYARDLENFRVSVHSMKTMLSIIGASGLSEIAFELERYSKNDEIDFCVRLFGEFKEKLLKLHEKISAIFQNATEEKSAAENSVAENSAAENSAAPPAEETSLTGRVLLVDDTEMVLYIIKEKLLTYGLDVDTAASGPEAIDKVKNSTYDLVLMDHIMPKMDGVEATREIRHLASENEKLPIVALTANTDSGEEFFLSNGFDGYIEKPVKGKLGETLKEWLPPSS